jgi:formylmethanofuran dehydrogenase subunit E
MTKVIAWIIVIFLVLFALRIVNQRKARARRNGAETQAKVAGMATVRCSRCGVFLPLSDARESAGKYVCADSSCSPAR